MEGYSSEMRGQPCRVGEGSGGGFGDGWFGRKESNRTFIVL